MLTLTAAVQNPAQIVPRQCGEELSVTRVQSVPKLQNTDNWHICHLPPKCLAHAEKFTPSAGGPSSVLLGQRVGGRGGEKSHSIADMGPSTFVQETPPLKVSCSGASLVAQWLRICLLMQGTRVRALVWEDPTCHGAAGPVSHNY